MPEGKPAPLRVVLLYSSGHLGSALVLNLLSRMPEVKITGMVRAEPLPGGRKRQEALKKHLRKVGWRFGWLMLWQRVVQGMGYGVSLLSGKSRLLPGWKIAKENHIPVHCCERVNDPVCIAFLEACAPDLLVSAYFSQILKKPVLSVPKIGALNIHPGLLPEYRGAMSYFWVLKNGEDKAGVTLHWMDEQIDTGAVVASRSFIVPAHTTQQQVLARTAILGARLLQQALRRIQRGEKPGAPEDSEKDARYFAMPQAEDFEAYFVKRRFFRIRNTLGLLLRGWKRRKLK